VEDHDAGETEKHPTKMPSVISKDMGVQKANNNVQ
jgi:hypothetical protein